MEYKHPAESWGEQFTFSNDHGKMTRLTTSMIGQHQVENAGMAIELYQIYCLKEKIPFREKEIIKGLKRAHWPGRMEKLSNEPLVVLDGAHNAHAVQRIPYQCAFFCIKNEECGKYDRTIEEGP